MVMKRRNNKPIFLSLDAPPKPAVSEAPLTRLLPKCVEDEMAITGVRENPAFPPSSGGLMAMARHDGVIKRLIP